MTREETKMRAIQEGLTDMRLKQHGRNPDKSSAAYPITEHRMDYGKSRMATLDARESIGRKVMKCVEKIVGLREKLYYAMGVENKEGLTEAGMVEAVRVGKGEKYILELKGMFYEGLEGSISINMIFPESILEEIVNYREPRRKPLLEIIAEQIKRAEQNKKRKL